MSNKIKLFLINVLWFIVIVSLGYFVYLQYFAAKPCQQPIEYKIGTLDPRFGVSESQFKADISQASNIWSKAIGKNLFEYNPNGALTINLVYDTRQQTTQKEQVLNADISQDSNVADSVKQEFNSLESQYNTAQQDYQNQLTQFNQAQDDYNTQVQSWNAKGGAPEPQYSQLKSQANDLQNQQNALEAKRQEVNDLVDQINALIKKYNLLVSQVNTTVNEINTDGLSGTTFEEGVYVSGPTGKYINIYQFNNQTFFIRVLAHELGHSLGLQHNSNPDSIMNPVNQSTNLIPTKDDLQELKTECGIK